MTDKLIQCPRCKGTKRNSTNTGECLCCHGNGTITELTAETLKRVGSDIRKRLEAKGIILD